MYSYIECKQWHLQYNEYGLHGFKWNASVKRNKSIAWLRLNARYLVRYDLIYLITNGVKPYIWSSVSSVFHGLIYQILQTGSTWVHPSLVCFLYCLPNLVVFVLMVDLFSQNPCYVSGIKPFNSIVDTLQSD